MTRTRAGASSSHDGNDDDLPPPPLPSAQEFFAQFLGSQRTMEEALCLIAQNTARCHPQQQGPEPNQHSTLKEFLDTKPPIFKVAEEPLQVDEWLNTIEQKFRLPAPEGRVYVPSATGTGRDLVDPFPILFTYQCIGYVGAVQVSL